MSKIGTTELLVILAIALLIFGPTVLPKFGKAMGKTIAGFKKGVSETDFDDEVEEVPESKKSQNVKKSKVKETEDKPVKKKKAKPVEESEDEDDADAEDDADSEDDE
jgi:sec-independent protein translocase protein TatA